MVRKSFRIFGWSVNLNIILGNDVIRTCINDLNFCDLNPGKCEHICKGDRCNNNDICAALCSGEMCNEICNGNQSGNKCVRYQNENQLRLGCIDNLSEICDTEENHCSTCGENWCNAAGNIHQTLNTIVHLTDIIYHCRTCGVLHVYNRLFHGGWCGYQAL